MHYILAAVEGLHLTCDFVIYSAALYGCPPDYETIPTLAHDAYREPYKYLGSVPFTEYQQFADISAMDAVTLEACKSLPPKCLKDFTCVAFELTEEIGDISEVGSMEQNDQLLDMVLERGERIIDTLRLFLFKPGNNTSIGRVGAMGNGLGGAWIGDDGDHAKFVSRRVSSYEFVQAPMEVALADLRRIYNDDVFKELKSAACYSADSYDPLLNRIFQGLRAFRESRKIEDAATRFVRLGTLAEHLAKKEPSERYQGRILRERIAKIAQSGRYSDEDILSTTIDLWDNVRNPLTHSVESFAEIGRVAEEEIARLEKLVINMLQAVTTAWKLEEFVGDPYAYLLAQAP